MYRPEEPQFKQAEAPQPNIKVNLQDASEVVCQGCGNNTFVQVVFIRHISALVSPSGKEADVPVATFACNSCGHVNDKFDPFTDDIDD